MYGSLRSLAIVAVLFVAVACGDSESTPATPAIPDAAPSDAAPPDAAIAEVEISAIEGQEHHCPVEPVEGESCQSDPHYFWWCTHATTCDIWGCAPDDQGGAWTRLEAAPAGGCTDGCPHDFDAAAEMRYCEAMVCLEQTGDECRELRCINGPGYDYYVLSDVDCPSS